MLRSLALVCVVATVVAAQPADHKANKVDAQSLVQSGVKLLEAKDYLGALAVFKTAYERFPSTKILLDIGTALKYLDRDPDAANAYQRYIDANDAEAKRRTELHKLVDKIDKTAGRYEITAAPSDATVTIDDDDWLHVVHGQTWRVTPGRHAVTVKAAGYVPKTKSVEVAAGESIALEIQLAPLPKQTPTVITIVEPRAKVVAVPRDDGPRSRFGALVLGHFDIPHGGAALVGVTADVTRRVEARATAILGPKIGAYAGATFSLLTDRYRPYLSAGIPVFFSSGVRYGIRGAGGLEWIVNRHLAFVIEAGVEHEFNLEMGVTKATVFVPAAGVIGRL
ncbi:MAG: PEGA domain-containing protein [Kofleriaceae bacterium]